VLPRNVDLILNDITLPLSLSGGQFTSPDPSPTFTYFWYPILSYQPFLIINTSSVYIKKKKVTRATIPAGVYEIQKPTHRDHYSHDWCVG